MLRYFQLTCSWPYNWPIITMFSKLQSCLTAPFKRPGLLAYYGVHGLKIPKEQWQNKSKLSPEFNYDRKRSSYINIAISCFMFALCFAGIPIYRTFCEHMGLVGDTDKKVYDFKGKKIANLKKFKVVFEGIAEPGVDWQFEPVQKQVYVAASQTAIVFYKLYNRSQKSVVGFSTYNISPEDANVYFSKIQCFCFNQQMINPKQQLLLPLFFYLEPEINDDYDVGRIPQIKLTYHFLKSAKQDLAKFAEQELKRVDDNKRKLREMRAAKMRMSQEQYQEYVQVREQREQADNLKAISEAEIRQKQLQQEDLRTASAYTGKLQQQMQNKSTTNVQISTANSVSAEQAL